MIEVSLNSILSNIEVFRQLSNQVLPIKTAFEIARLIRELDKENKIFEDCRKKIIEKYAERTEDGEMKANENGNIIIPEDKLDDCNNEILELLNEVVTINAEKVDLETLDNIQLTPTQVLMLEPFVKE